MRIAAGILVFAIAGRAAAQSLSSVPALDSANAARAAWGSALRALRANDLTAAQTEAGNAAAAWPAQSAYHWYHAMLAARRRDTAVVREALLEYARMGLGRDLSDSTFDSFRRLPWFAAVAAEHDANRKPIVRSRVRAILSDSSLWPESVDYHPATGSFYVTSVRHRTIVEVMRDGRERELWPERQPALGAILGIRVDHTRDLLWVTTSGIPQMSGFRPQDTMIAALLQVRRIDGVILRRWDLSHSGPALLGDVAIGPAGDVFVTDSRNPVLYVLRFGADTLERIRHPLFRSLQGIAPTADGSAVYVADYSHGLLRVDLPSQRIVRVGDAPGSTTLGCDGIAWHDNAIVAIQNGHAPARVMRFTLDSNGTRVVKAQVLDQNTPLADEPTSGTIVGNEFIYVANSQWEKYTSDGTRRAGTLLARPILLAVPLRQ